MLGAMRDCFAADRPVRTTSSVHEVMSIRGLGRPRKSPHRAEERRARALGGRGRASRMESVVRVQESQARTG